MCNYVYMYVYVCVCMQVCVSMHACMCILIFRCFTFTKVGSGSSCIRGTAVSVGWLPVRVAINGGHLYFTLS